MLGLGLELEGELFASLQLLGSRSVCGSASLGIGVVHRFCFARDNRIERVDVRSQVEQTRTRSRVWRGDGR